MAPKASPTQKILYLLLADPNIKSKTKKSLINSLANTDIKNICEFTLNILNKNIPLNSVTYKKLLPHARSCRKLVNKKISIKEKKKILIGRGVQVGGFLEIIIPAIISALGGIISSFVSSNSP